MDWNIENIENIVVFINKELQNNRAMTDIEKIEFNANARVIHKRLLRLGYKKIDNQYIKENELELSKNTKVVQEKFKKEPIKKIQEKKEKKKETYLNMNIEMDKLKELLELLEPIKELLKKDKDNTRKVVNNNLEIPIIKNVKQRTVKIDINILKEWDNFIEDHSNYKAQDLISQALKEFMENHKK